MSEKYKQPRQEYTPEGMHVDDYGGTLSRRWAAIVACVSLAASVAILGIASPYGEGVRNALSKIGENPIVTKSNSEEKEKNNSFNSFGSTLGK